MINITMLLIEKNSEINNVNSPNNANPTMSNFSSDFPFSSGTYFFIYGIVYNDKNGSANITLHPIYVEINPPARIPTAPETPTHAVL